MAYNYSGPTQLNTAFHNVPHIDVQGNGGLFDVNPHSVVHDTVRYEESIGVFALILLALLLAGTIVFWVWECTLYSCCQKCRENCTCKCCPKGYCKTVALRRGRNGLIATDAPCMTTSIVFTVFAASAALITLAFVTWFSYETTQTLNDAIKLEDYHDASLAQLQAIQALTKSNNDSIALLAPDVYASNISARIKVNFTAAVIESDAAETSATDAVNQASSELHIRSNVKYVRDNRGYFVALATFLIVIAMLILMAEWLVSVLPPEPLGPCIGVLSGFQILVFYLVTWFVFADLFTVGVEMGDVCQDPNAYINEFNAKQGGGSFLSFYINCAPGSTNPTLDDLNSAYANTLVARTAIGLVANVTTPPSSARIHNESLALYDQQSLTLLEIQVAINASTCDVPHNLLSDVETQACHANMTSGVAFILSLAIFHFLAVLIACFIPRRNSSYSPVSGSSPGE